MDEKVAVCALNRIFGFEPRLGTSLMEYAGSASAVFGMDKEEIREAMGPYWKYISQIVPGALEEARREIEAAEEEGAEFIGICEERYPKLLMECEDPPLGIYIKSYTSAEEVFSRPAVAIVGTRDMSQYGQEWCRRLVEAMAHAEVKPLIVSGLAYGIDITAHTAALEYGLPTAGVMATGIDAVYPQRHLTTADRMVSTAGCALVTDYPLGTSPLAIHFMRRNRLIAGLASSTILIESRIKGGGMITARLANSYCRDVYALPGRLDDIRSQGCNMLIRDKMAEPVTDPESMVERLGLGGTMVPGRKDTATLVREACGSASADDFADILTVAETIRKNRGIDAGGIQRKTGLPYGRVSGIVEMLAADGLVSTDLLGHCSFI